MSAGRVVAAAALAASVAASGCDVHVALGKNRDPEPLVVNVQERPLKEVIDRPGNTEIFSRVVRVGNLLFFSGTIGTRAEEEGVGPETRAALETIQSDLEALGGTMRDVAKCTVFLADMADYQAMNAVYREFFAGSPPARSTVGADLVANAKVEIECVAAAPGGGTM